MFKWLQLSPKIYGDAFRSGKPSDSTVWLVAGTLSYRRAQVSPHDYIPTRTFGHGYSTDLVLYMYMFVCLVRVRATKDAQTTHTGDAEGGVIPESPAVSHFLF
jgi:uncharacterized membrane protein YkvA (DUF1232 family)